MLKLIKSLLFGSCILCLSGCNLIRSANSELAKWNNDLDQEWKIQDSNKRLANYEWFYEQYGAIKSTAAKAKLSTGDEQKQVLMVLSDMVETYNSRSRQSKTKALWKAQDLPYQIDLDELMEGKE